MELTTTTVKDVHLMYTKIWYNEGAYHVTSCHLNRNHSASSVYLKCLQNNGVSLQHCNKEQNIAEYSRT